MPMTAADNDLDATPSTTPPAKDAGGVSLWSGAYATIPSVITIREGQTAQVNLSFLNLMNHSAQYQYATTTSGGTATSSDLGSTSGSGSFYVVSSGGYNERIPISISALADDQTENTETAYLAVSLGGNVPFEDGSMFKYVEIRIVDNNMVDGTDGSDILRGTSRAEVLTGGLGNDRYYVTPGDQVVESTDGGVDEIVSATSWVLDAEVEQLTLTGSSAIHGTGNGLDNRLEGNSGANTLNGAGGKDVMAGGLGNDTYITDGQDEIVESTNGGNDRMFTSVSTTLAENVETLILAGSADLTAIGNSQSGQLIGNAGANLLYDGLGDDTLNGGAGTDTLVGGGGNDVYITDGRDSIREAANGGVDTMYTSASTNLALNVETLILTGNANLKAIGNSQSGQLIGNAGANLLYDGLGNDTLNGGAGADTLVGGGGNDVYITDGRDSIREAANGGIDTMYTSASTNLALNVETLILTGSANLKAIGNSQSGQLIGNAGANLLYDGLGNDTLNGGAGADTLVGGAGSDVLHGGVDTARDVFVFSSIEHSKVGTARDIAAGFISGIDDFDLRGIDANTNSNGDQAFRFGGYSETANGIWLVDVGNNLLIRGDVNGDGKADFEVQVSAMSSLTQTDFLL